MNDCVLCEVKDTVALVTINLPKALNALNSEVISALYEQMEQLERNPRIKAVIITGAGEKAFVAGADIASMSRMTPQEATAFSQAGHRTMDKIAAMRPVTIAAINGFALGGGCELAMSCDIRIASAKAQMGIPEVTLGVIPGFGGTQRLPRLVGLGMAMELLVTGRRCKADECEKIGLVNHVVEPEQLMDYCMKLAESISKNSGSAVSIGKQAMSAGVEMDLGKGLALEASTFALTFAIQDQKEGMTAFLEKRPARFL